MLKQIIFRGSKPCQGEGVAGFFDGVFADVERIHFAPAL